MSVLDPKREVMAAAYVANGGKQSEAYKSAHPNSKASKRSIAVEASKIFSEPDMRLRVAELQSAVAKQSTVHAALTLDAHVAKLLALREKAELAGNIPAAIKAEELIGQLGKHYVKQVETGKAGDFERMSDEELREHIANEAKELGVATKANGTRH